MIRHPSVLDARARYSGGLAPSALRCWQRCALSLWGLAAMPARAELQVNVTQGVTDPIPIAIVPFARAVPADGGLDLAGVVQHDLESSGRFRAMQRRDMLSTPTRAAEVQAADWKAAGNDYVLVGRVTAPTASEIDVECDLINTLTGQRIGGKRFVATGASLRNAAHMVSDFVYESILGVRGAFATRIAYIAVQGQAPTQHFQLIVADSDGESPRGHSRIDTADHVAGLVAGRSVARLRVVRESAVGDLHPARAHRRASAGLAARRRQRRAGVLTRRHAPGADAFGQRRQSRYLVARPMRRRR